MATSQDALYLPIITQVQSTHRLHRNLTGRRVCPQTLRLNFQNHCPFHSWRRSLVCPWSGTGTALGKLQLTGSSRVVKRESEEEHFNIQTSNWYYLSGSSKSHLCIHVLPKPDTKSWVWKTPNPPIRVSLKTRNVRRLKKILTPPRKHISYTATVQAARTELLHAELHSWGRKGEIKEPGSTVLRKLPSLTCRQALTVIITPRYVNGRTGCPRTPSRRPRRHFPPASCRPLTAPRALGGGERLALLHRLRIHPPARLLSAPALGASRQDTSGGKGFCKRPPNSPPPKKTLPTGHRSGSRLAPSLPPSERCGFTGKL